MDGNHHADDGGREGASDGPGGEGVCGWGGAAVSICVGGCGNGGSWGLIRPAPEDGWQVWAVQIVYFWCPSD